MAHVTARLLDRYRKTRVLYRYRSRIEGVAMNTYADLGQLYFGTTSETDLARSALPHAPQQPVTASRFDVRGWWKRHFRREDAATVQAGMPAGASAPASLARNLHGQSDAADDRR